MCILAPFWSFHDFFLLLRVISAFHRPCFYSLEPLVHIETPFCSFYAFHRPCSYSLVSLVCIPAPFCSFYAFHRPCSYSLVSLVRILALSVLLMDCIDLSLTRNSHCCASQLHFALVMHSTDLDLTRERHRCIS